MYYRVFAMTDAEVQPAEMLEHLQKKDFKVKGHFRGDAEGWFEAELALEDVPFVLLRYLPEEEGVRADLNAYAAWVELQEEFPQREQLMQQLISTRQFFILRIPDEESEEAPLRKLGKELCQYLSERTDGFYQMDGKGFFTREGNVIVAE